MTQEQKLAIIAGTLGVIVLLCVAAFALATFFSRNAGGPIATGAGPQVLIKSPQQGATVPINQDVPVQVSASDSNGVIRIELYVNGTQVASESSPNTQGLQSFSPTLTWRPTNPGNYGLQARAVNRNNVTGESAVIQVTAQANATPQPTPTNSPTPTNTPLPPASSPTPIIIVVTATPTAPPPTSTNTRPPPSPTATSLPPTSTAVPPTATRTSVPPVSTQVLKQATINGNDNGQAIAACPGGTKVTGGGFGGDVSLTITGSAMQGNAWQVLAKNTSGTSHQLIALAICVSNLPGTTTQVFAQASVQPNATATPTAQCPSGSTLTGGGYGSNAQQIVYANSNVGNAWQVGSKNITTTAQTLNVFAVCYNSAGASSTTANKQSDVNGGANATVTADCPADKIVTGGGYTAAQGLVVTNSSKTGNSWQVSATNGLTSTLSLTAVAVCTGF
ncbi:MAG: hypothetical protein E6J26_03045 [Chloroflexi bacterium]|nr:MAG: hypothetical protein E6J26_03045 [Chloroflexota bacterium]